MSLTEDVGRLAAMTLWQHLDELVAAERIVVDRPHGSHHPRIAEYVYPLDYGYLDNTVGGDGQGIDAWQGSSGQRVVTAVFCTYDPMKRDAELKLAVGCRPDEIRAIEEFYAPQPQAVVTLRRPEPESRGMA